MHSAWQFFGQPIMFTFLCSDSLHFMCAYLFSFGHVKMNKIYEIHRKCNQFFFVVKCGYGEFQVVWWWWWWESPHKWLIWIFLNVSRSPISHTDPHSFYLPYRLLNSMRINTAHTAGLNNWNFYFTLPRYRCWLLLLFWIHYILPVHMFVKCLGNFTVSNRTN